MASLIKVLLVEDDSGDALLVEEMLAGQAVAFDVSVRSTLAASLEFLSRNQVDVSVVDLDLPDAFEGTAIAEIRRNFPLVPVVVLTGSDDPEAGFALIQQGAQDFLVKGATDAGRLAMAIRYAVERACVDQRLYFAEADARRKNDRLKRLEAEIAALTRLAERGAADPPGALGPSGTLRASLPDTFKRLVDEYAGALDQALLERRVEFEPRSGAKIKAIAGELCQFSARPQDVIDLHCQMLRGQTGGVPAEHARAIRSEARLTALALMGHLAAAYRDRAPSLDIADG